jgi:hypothetical protein
MLIHTHILFSYICAIFSSCTTWALFISRRHHSSLALGHDTRCHVFHQECIVEWLCCQNGCPVCPQDFLSLEDLDEAATELTESMGWVHGSTPHRRDRSESGRWDVQPPTEGTEDRPVDDAHREYDYNSFVDFQPLLSSFLWSICLHCQGSPICALWRGWCIRKTSFGSLNPFIESCDVLLTWPQAWVVSAVELPNMACGRQLSSTSNYVVLEPNQSNATDCLTLE